MKKVLIGIILVLLVAGMANTVPDKKAHKEAMMKAIKEYVDEEAEEKGLGDNIFTNLGKGIVNKTIEFALNSKLEVTNYFLFNTTHVQLGDEKKTLSLGVFGHVFTFDKEMLRDALEASAKDKADAKAERKSAKEAAKEAKRLKKQLKKEQRKREKALRKEQKQKEKEQKRKEKERHRQEKEAKKKAKEKGSV